MKQLGKQEDGFMRLLVFDVAFDDDVPKNQRGQLDLVEDGASIAEVVDIGVGIERKEARRD